MTPSSPPPRTRARRRAEAGQASGEQLAIVIVAVLLAIALIAPAPRWGSTIAQGITCAIGRIVGEGCTVEGETPTPPAEDPRDYRPPQCTVRNTVDGYDSKVTIGFVTFGEDQVFMVEEAMVRNPDGTLSPQITVTATDGGNLGLVWNFGPSAELGTSSIGAEGKLGGEFTFHAGDEWVFDSVADYEAFRQQWTDYEIQEMQLSGEGAAGIAIAKWLGLLGGFIDPPRSPDRTSTAYGANFEGELSAGAYLFDNGKSGGNKEPLNLNIGLYAEVDVAGQRIVTTDNRPGHEGERSTTYAFSGDLNGGADAVVVGGDVVQLGTEGAFQIDERVLPDGTTEVTGITFTTTRNAQLGVDPHINSGPFGNGHEVEIGGDGPDAANQTTVTTTHLEVTAQNRDVVNAWLAANNDLWQAGKIALPWASIAPTQPSADDPFNQLLYEEGITTLETFETTSDNLDLGISLAFGLEFGWEGGVTDEESVPVSAQYLDAPGPDGQRRFVDNTACVT